MPGSATASQRSARLRTLIAGSALVVFATLCLVPSVQGDGAPAVLYQGMLGDEAKISIDNRTFILMSPGEKRHGIELLSISKTGVVVRYKGTSYRYEEGSREAEALPHQVMIDRDSNHMFTTRGTIDGMPVEFMVDTGASHVVISANRARALRLRYNRRKPMRMTTASRMETAYAVTLRSVGVGGIVKHQVPALVTRSKFPRTVLLGMSFLNDLSINQEGDRLVIRE